MSDNLKAEDIGTVPTQTQPEVQLTEAQLKAKTKFEEWWGRVEENADIHSATDFSHVPQVHRIFGYAGVGKTTVTKRVVAGKRGIAYMAFTGKAAMVMRKHGTPATTIHSQLYKPVVTHKEEYQQLTKSLDEAQAKGDHKTVKELRESIAEARKVRFVINEESRLYHDDISLLVLDEVSMVGEENGRDLLSVRKPILVLGDPGQLPPIQGQGYFTNQRPDSMLEEIHRQALGNPIIKLSFSARSNVPVPRGEWEFNGKLSFHRAQAQAREEDFVSADQIIIGKNAGRLAMNRKMRAVLGRSGTYPVKDDKLICLKNDSDLGIFNGQMFTVMEVLDNYDKAIHLKLLDDDGNTKVVLSHRAHFDEYHEPGKVKDLAWWEFKNTQQFDFGYCITVHKAQGSQYDTVCFIDDKFFVWDRPNRAKWLYTGVTRAAESIRIFS